MAIPTLRSKNQLTIPAAVAKEAGVEVGDALEIRAEGGRIVVEKRFTEPSRENTPSAADWLAAADFVGRRDRELLNRLAQ